jgi:hypothetical protein
MTGRFKLSLADQLGIAALVVALVGIAVAVYYGRRALRPPKRKLRWNFSADPLFLPHNEDWRSVIDIRVFNERVRNPYFATLTLSNIGQEDISSAHFDQGRPIEFEITGKVATLQPFHSSSAATVEGTRVMFGPELLRAGHSWTVRMVTDGQPDVRLSSSYLIGASIDGELTDVEMSNSAQRRASSESLRIAELAAVGTIVAAVIGAIASIWGR